MWRSLKSRAFAVSLLLGSIALGAVGCAVQSESAHETAANRTTDAQSPAGPFLAALKPGWNRLQPGGATQCSDGSDYAFFVRAGDPDKLLVFLQGGGACWNLETCDPLLRPTYTINIGDMRPQDFDGVFNYERGDNPFATHTVVFAPYCSADVHIGRATQTYRRSPEQKAKIQAKGEHRGPIPDQFTITHRGFDNVAAVLDWTYAHVRSPETVFVTGSSAGSIPSPYYAMHIARAYPDAQITQLGDGAGGYRRVSQVSNPNASWNTVPIIAKEPAFAGMTDADFNYEQLYIRAAAAAPTIRFNAYDAAEDDVQKRFLELGGVQMPTLKAAITANQNDIRQTVPQFRSYIAGGDSHTILRRPEFYTYRVGDISIRDWIANLAAGQPVENIVCDDCTVAATIQ